MKVVELKQYQAQWAKRIAELEHALKTIKPEEKIVEKEKIVYYEDEERINDLNEKIVDLESEIGKKLFIA